MDKATDITMATEVLKELDLTQSPLCENLLAEDVGNFFDGYPVASLIICCGTTWI